MQPQEGVETRRAVRLAGAAMRPLGNQALVWLWRDGRGDAHWAAGSLNQMAGGEL